MSSRQLLATGLSLAVIGFLAAACGGGSEQPAGSAAPPAAAAPTDKADGPGVISGTVKFDGTPPKPRPLPMDSDPRCVPEPGATSEVLVVGPGGGLKNVFVYVKDGLGSRTYAVPTSPVVLDQKGCRYLPHVFGVQAGQTFQIVNGDATLHNVHAVPKVNREFNFGQPPKVPAVDRVFDKPEIGAPIRCDVHGWMNAYVNVVPHPFFAVTADDGTFEIKGLPPGTYTVELWHERLGTQTQSVTVDAAAPAKVTASFKPAT
jgi:plastocyanin